MNTNDDQNNSHEVTTDKVCSQSPKDPSPENSGTFQIIPHNSSRPISQPTDDEQLAKKKRPDSLEQNISEQQRPRLFEWLAYHSYSEVREIVRSGTTRRLRHVCFKDNIMPVL